MKCFRTVFCLLVAAVFSLSLAHSQDDGAVAPEEQDQWTVIHAGTLIARPGERPKRNQSVIVKNDRIDAIRAGFVSVEEVAEGAALVDLQDAYVLPGLIDAHVHMDAGSANDKYNYYGEESYPPYFTVLVLENAKRSVEAGVTTVRDLGGAPYVLAAANDAIAAGVFAGPRIIFAGEQLHVGASEMRGNCFDVSSCRKETLSRIEKGARWIKLYGTCSGFAPCGGEDGRGLFFEDELGAIVETAASRKVHVATHAHGTDGVIDALNAGARSVEHGTFSNDKARQLFKKTGAFLVPTLSVLDELNDGEEDLLEIPLRELNSVQRVMRMALDEHPRRVGLAYKAGVKIGVGTDAGLTPHGGIVNELLWLVKIGMTPAEAIRAATITNADLLDMEGDLGSIEDGKYADIIAVEEDPYKDIEAMNSVQFVMANGKIVLNGEIVDHRETTR